MATMGSFDYILNWKLKQGSHAFPGKDGGTCINEAAVVAAGFPYRPIRDVKDMPNCFSRPICCLAMQLNDEADDEERQDLLPYVTRLGCADTAEVEREREAYITSRRIYCLSFWQGLQVLERALAIGRQADVLGAEEVRTRMDAVQQNAATPTSVPDDPLIAKIKSWFAATKKAETTG
jgi:hypothetical protein